MVRSFTSENEQMQTPKCVQTHMGSCNDTKIENQEEKVPDKHTGLCSHMYACLLHRFLFTELECGAVDVDLLRWSSLREYFRFLKTLAHSYTLLANSDRAGQMPNQLK